VTVDWCLFFYLRMDGVTDQRICLFLKVAKIKIQDVVKYFHKRDLEGFESRVKRTSVIEKSGAGYDSA
jgi:hypothetical protein